MNCFCCQGSFEKEGREPLLLPACGHTLCRVCLARFTQHSGFLCPSCRQRQPKMDLPFLHPNHALLQVIEAQKEENGRHGKKKAGSGRGNEDNRNNNNNNNSSNNNNKNKEAVCMEHGRTRLAYWCGRCRVAACGECVVEKHSGGGGGGGGGVRHQPIRIEAALEERRNGLQNLVLEVTRSMDLTEEKRIAMAETSPIVMGAKRLQEVVGSVMGKMRIVASLLACQIQESEGEDTDLAKLRREWDELIYKVPQASSCVAGSFAELMALLDHMKEIEKFRDGPVAVVVKDTEAAVDKSDQQAFIDSAMNLTATLNTQAASLCRQVAVHSGEGRSLEVVGGGGLVGRLTWDHYKHSLRSFPIDLHHNGLHVCCLRRPTAAAPRPPPTDPFRRNALKWVMVQTQMHEVHKVFLVLVWGKEGLGGTGKELIFLELHHPESSAAAAAAVTTAMPHRRFLHLLTGDDSDGNNSLLGALSTSVEVVAGTGLRGILLGTHHKKREVEEKQGKKGSSNAQTNDVAKTLDSPVTSSVPSPQAASPGDVVCMKGQESEDDMDFWLVTETKESGKTPVSYVAVASILSAHKTLLGKLPSLRDPRIEDCGAVLWCRACLSN